MPSLGADMEAGTLVEWLVKPGDPVKRGDIVAVVETQKGAIEIEVFEDGTVRAGCSSSPARRSRSARRWREIRGPERSRRSAGASTETGSRARPAAAPPAPAPAPAACSGRSRRARTRPAESARLAGRAQARRGEGHRSRRHRRHRPGRQHRPCRRRSGVARRPGAPRRPPPRTSPRRAASISAPCATRDRRGDGAVEARDPALLSRALHRPDRGAGLARQDERRAGRRPSGCSPARCCSRPWRWRCKRFPEFNGFYEDGRVPAQRSDPCRRGDRDPRRRPGRAGDPRRRHAGARRR